MRVPMSLVIAASGILAASATAQMAPPPPPGGGMMRADANRDGTITRAEMVAEADARFAAMDTDKDGKVTAAERDAARDAMRAQRRDGAGGGGARGGGGMGMSMGMRGDPDGVLTRAEAVQRAGARFDRLDANRDGSLDAGELAAARPMRGPRANRAAAPATPAQ